MLNTTGPMAALYKAIIAWAAGYRNQRHSENVRLGQARKRAQVEGTGEQYHHGRRPIDESIIAKVRQLAAQGLSQRKIAFELSISVGTVNTYVKQL
jgi:DNA invertase Pin-like site-specific DNA recombinase